MYCRNIFIIGMSFSVITTFSCKGGNNNSDMSDSDKSKTYLKVNLESKDETALSWASNAISAYSFNVTVKCTNAYEGGITSNESYTITNANPRIPVVSNKDCDIEFNFFDNGLSGTPNEKFIPDSITPEAKLILSYKQNGEIIKRNKAGHYVDDKTKIINKYINGSKAAGTATPLNLYVSSTPDQQNGITPENVNNDIPTTEATLALNHLTAPDAFPIKITKTNDRIGGIATSNFRYKFTNTESTPKTDWPNNCKIISIDHLNDPADWYKVDNAYNDVTNSKDCNTSGISLTANTDWSSRLGKIQYIILATDNIDSLVQKAYRVITIPAM